MDFRYVHFTSQPEADAAIEQFNNFEVDGKTLRVMSADQKPSGGGSSDSQGGFSRGDSGGRRPWANPSGSTSGNDTMGSYDTSSRAPKPQTKVMGIPLTLTEVGLKFFQAASNEVHLLLQNGRYALLRNDFFLP